MFHNDYILRMLDQVSQVVAYLTGLRRAGQHEKADAEIELAYMQYVGLSGKLFEMMAAEDIITLLNLSGQDWVRVAVTANLMLEEARGHQLRAESRQSQVKHNKAEQLMRMARQHLDPGSFDAEFLDMDKFMLFRGDEDT
jgi:hypothetical protein